MERVTPTIRDVAERAGVSAGTASRALNGHDRVSPATRLAVQAAADELHYVPNALIRSLQSGRTNTVGLFLWRVEPSAPASIATALVQGLLASLGEADRDALFYHRHPHEQQGTPAYFLDGRVDGVILAPGFLSHADITTLVQAGMPLVALYQGSAGGAAGTVNVASRAGASMAVRRLVELGHRRIAFVAPAYTFDYQERRAGWAEALAANGLPIDPALCPEIASEHGPEIPCSVRGLMALDRPPSAIVAGDDAVAMCVLDELGSLGVAVPRRVSVVGFDDVLPAGEERCLSTLRHPATEVGLTAGRFMGRLLSGVDPSECRAVLPVSYVERGTTGPAPG
jgi:LacI family transcriptional regulator